MSVLADRIADLSPEKQALLLQHLRKGDQGLKPAHIQRRSATDWLPLSFAQQRLWFLDQLEPNSVVYNIPVALRLTGSLNMLALQRSLNEVVHRHEVLRTTFVTIGEQVRQVIAPVLCLDVPLLNLQILPKVDREREAMRLATEEAQRPFDLAHGPLLRIRLLRLGDEDHALLLVFHHIIADGWSLGVLVRELTALYTAFAAGRPSPLPELPIQYADFACWQREWLQGKVLEKQLAYWQRQLGDELPILDLPTDRPRPAAQTYRGARLTFTLAPALSRAIVSLSQREGVTLFMTLLAAFQVLLYRYSGQTDLTVGTPIANRNRAEIEPLIGFFANTLVLRTDLSNEPNFHELLRRAREVALDAYANQDVPFEVLVDRLRPDRSLDRSPLFQAMFALQKPLLPLLQLASLNISQMEVQPGTAKFDLLLEMDEAPDTFRGVFEYNTDLFDASTIQRMSGHFQTLLTGLVVDPNRPIDTVPLLTGTERRLLLTEWTSTESDYPREARLHQRVELQATRTPDAIAVIYEGRSLTYHELNSQANQLAHYLRRHEVGPGAVVALYLERSPEMVVAMLGVLKAGGAYLPLDLTYPAGRLAFMLQDSNVSVVLTQAALLSSLPAGDITPICLDTGWDIIAQESETNPTGGATPDHLAYALYTSGSTGIPKGVMISHRAICNHMFWMQQAFPLTPADRVLQKTPVSFDASVWEFYAPLWAGAVLVLARQDGHRDSAYLVEAIRGHRITILQLVPTLLRMLLQEPGFSQCRTLRRIFCGGEALTADLQERLYATLPVELHNLYGPTEASIDATFWSCRMSDRQPIVPIGRPIANMQAYVLDHILQPLPVGVPGELYIGGVGLARGYLHRPELTAERFLPNPYGGKANEKLYRTGDRVRWRADGTLEFLGRSDHQVKVRGFRIELGEVEMSLSRHPDVREVAVVVREDIPGDKQLVAYLVPAHAGQTPPVSELRGFLKARLPDYMVPSAFVTLEALPLTPNGKLDRRALPAPDEIAAPGEAYVPPHTPTEELLAGIWSQVLHRVKVSVTVNFFEMGGHSLLATQVISRVREICQVELPLRALFEAPTIASLAAMVEQARQGTRCLAAPPIQRIHHSDSQPLSFAQQRLWFLDQLEPGSPLYNIAAAVRLSGALDSMALEQSINEVISRHDVLRTTFEATDGRPTQRIASKLAISLPMVDISALAKLEQEAKVQTLAVEEARRPFTLTLGPLLRARILRLSHQEHIMLFVMHHAIADGWSMSVLIREVATLYRAIKTGQPAYLPELRVQYADFAQWQRTWLQGETLEHQLGYWKQQLAGSLPLLELPIDRPRPLVQTSHGAMHPVEFPQALADQLVTLSHREGVTLFMTLLAALKVLLHRYARATDICVGTPIANRTRAEIEDLIGCFVNTLVLRTDLSGNPSFRELLR
ncbi:MAG: amino acid adenylation domain-containing protein, partial [Chloroflexi bacterium]|nr:amino acid adenylation domain-containing protein [Chloroflexota bacterium]